MQKKHEAEVQSIIASTSATISEEKERLEGQVQKHKDLLSQAEIEVTSAREEMETLKGKAEAWLSALTKINSEMSSKFFLHSFSADIPQMPV